MRPSHLLALAFLTSSQALFAQVYTTPAGYTSQTLQANTFNVVGFNVMNPTVVAGTFTGVNGANVSDTNVNFGTTLPAGKTCVVDITSGVAAGTVQEFVTWSANTITLPASVTGLAIGDSYKIRVCPTLQEIFPVGLLTGSFGATNADKVWVPTGTGTYTKYWYKTNSPIGWHTTSTGANDLGLVSADIPLVYIDGILVEKKGTSADLVLSGEVKKTGSNYLLGNGMNLISIIPPTGATLFTSGLQAGLTGSFGATNADIVWVPTGTGSYTKYWYKTNSPIGWHTTTTGVNDTGLVSVDINLPTSIFIQRKGTSTVLPMSVPAAYSSF